MVESSANHRRSRNLLVHGAMTPAGRIKSMRRATLATILVAVLMVTPALVSGSAKESRSILSRGTSPISTSNRHDILLSPFEVHRIPRGGGKGSAYLKVLDDEIVWLEQQLRRVEQEKRSLKKNMSKRQQIRDDLLESNGKSKTSSRDSRDKGKNSTSKTRISCGLPI
jgi:hypothetical protein